MAIHSNTVPVQLNIAAPDGTQIKVKQLDDAIRETRAALKTAFERAHQPFGDAKCGEPLPGSAVMFTGQNGNLGISYAETLGRLRYLWGLRALVTSVDRGTGPQIDNILGPSNASVLSRMTSSQVLTTSFAELNEGVTPIQVDYAMAANTNQPNMILRVELDVQMKNTTGADRSAAVRFTMAKDAGAFAPTNAAAEHIFNLGIYNPLNVTLKGGQAISARMVCEVAAFPVALARTLRFRVQARADTAASITINTGAIETESTLLRLRARRAHSETF